MGCRRHDVRMTNRRRMLACRYQAGNMSHIHHEQRIYAVRNGRHPFKVNDARIGAGAGDYHLGAVLFGQFFQFIIINTVRLSVNTIRNYIKIHARQIYRTAMGQMAAMRQIHAQKGIAMFKQSKIDSRIRLGS